MAIGDLLAAFAARSLRIALILASSIKVFVVALSLALDVFAVSIGVGMRGISVGLKVRIGIAFASAEVIMNVIGAGLGQLARGLLGDVAGYVGFAALFFVGCYMLYESRRDLRERTPLDLSQGFGLLLASLSISLDSLGIGFSILYIGVPVVVALGAIFIVSVLATTLGLTLGRRLGTVLEDRAEFLAGVLMMLTGLGLTVFKALHIG